MPKAKVPLPLLAAPNSPSPPLLPPNKEGLAAAEDPLPPKILPLLVLPTAPPVEPPKIDPPGVELDPPKIEVDFTVVGVPKSPVGGGEAAADVDEPPNIVDPPPPNRFLAGAELLLPPPPPNRPVPVPLEPEKMEPGDLETEGLVSVSGSRTGSASSSSGSSLSSIEARALKTKQEINIIFKS